ncbi:MAG: cadherin-like domain-containing protein, partial [Sulfuricurvum sp.]|nr:cadherin-like domain-containing protein [Sulfuricurvum sp.]MDP3022527.1 cadherin-like domain-containing protein [Sulfuricurvum sp.]
MSIEIGTVKTIVGKFWIHSANGESHLAVVGEMLHQGDRIVGDTANAVNATLSLDLVGNTTKDIVLGANDVLTLDQTFLKDVLTMEDALVNKASLVAAWDAPSEELSITIEGNKDALALADTEMVDGETAAGGAATDGQISPANFDERTGGITDVNTGLLDTNVDTQSDTQSDNTLAPIILNQNPILTDDNSTGSTDDALTTLEDTALTIAPSTLLANDTDPDGDTLTITSVQGAVNGTVALVDGNIVFTPDENYNGPASFTYTVSDGRGGEATATVNVGVTPVNDAPTIDVTAAATFNENDAVAGQTVATFSASDEEDGTLTVAGGQV